MKPPTRGIHLFFFLVLAGGVFGCNDMSNMNLLTSPITPTTQKQGESSGLPSKGPVKSGHFRTLASGDLNGDGIPELLSANLLSGDLVVWPGHRKNGWSTPTAIAAGAEISAVDLADIDADARLDIVVAFRRNGKSGIEVWRNLGELKFRRSGGPGKGEFFDDVHAADLNFDGRADLIAVKGVPSPRGSIRIWMNLGPGKWQAAPAPRANGSFHSVRAADLNQDGIIDLIAAGEGPGGGVRIWLGKSKDPGWGKANVLANGDFWSVNIMDLNGDQILDQIATGKNTGILIWQGLGKGNLNLMASPVSTGSFWYATAVDRDGDDRVDIVASTMDGNGLRYWKQQEGIGWISQQLLLPERGRYRHLLVADLDGDGRSDLGSPTHGNGISLWPGFGRGPQLLWGGNGSRNDRKKHNLPLIPGSKMPDLAADRQTSDAKARARKAAHLIEGARPEDRLPGEYVIGPADVLAITIWQGIKAEVRRVQVSERGLVSFGYVDDARAAGLTVREFDRVLTRKLTKFIKNPRIEVSITKFGSKIVRVMGAVARPRNIQISKAITVLDVILLAGGHITQTTRGNLERIKLQRRGTTQTVNLLRYISGSGEMEDNPLVQSDDLVFVPEASKEETQEPRIYVFGEAKRPGVYPFSFKMRALDAIARAGGFTDFGLPAEVRIIRGDPERPQVLLANLKNLLERGDRRGNILLEANDVVVIPRSVIGDLNDFIKQVSPILDFLFYPARLRDVYSINSNVLKFDVGGPKASRAEEQSEGTFSPNQPSTSIILQ
ncbi:FG-GAP-like repeat-containing protein [Nitrospinota bacterium]